MTTSPAQESPRDVFLAGCTAIGEYLHEFGYKYSKSGPHARRKSGDFVFQIRFQSSHHNIAGAGVALWIHGTVLSPRLKKWRESQPLLHRSDFVAGGQIGNLQTNHCWLAWNLADGTKRAEVVSDAIHKIEELAIPYFHRFEDLPALCKLLVDGDLRMMTIDRVVEFFMCFADQSTARKAAANFLQRRPDLDVAYRHAFEQYAEKGLDSKYPSGYAEQLAFASHVFKFGALT